MFKNIFLFISIFMISALVYSQNVSVTKTTALTSPEDGVFCFPQMDATGSRVFFSTPGHKGLYVYERKQKRIRQLSAEMGAGYEPAINFDGSEIVYRKYEIEKGRRFFSLVKFNLNSGLKTVLESSLRQLSPAKYINNFTLAYTQNKYPKKSIETPLLKKNVSEMPAVFIEDGKMVLIRNGMKMFIEPRGAGSYIWPEISPDGSFLLFKKLGDGCYISDLDGKIIKALGDLDAPHWSPDGNWIVYMADKDNGQVLTASELHIMNVTTGNDVQLTHTRDVIEIYPNWGKDKNTLVYCTARGQIYLMQLKWE